VTDSRSPLPLRPSQGVESESPPAVLGPLRGRGQKGTPQEQGQYGGPAGRARPFGLPYTPTKVNGVGAPQGDLEGDAVAAALRDSLDAFISTLHERLSFLETAPGASRRSRRRRRRLSSSSSDGEYSGGNRGRHVPRRAVARALGRELAENLHRRLS